MRQPPLKETSTGDGNLIAPAAKIKGAAASSPVQSPVVNASGCESVSVQGAVTNHRHSANAPVVTATNCGTVEVNVNHYPEGTGPALAVLLAKIDLLEAKIEDLTAVVNAGKKGKRARLTL